MNKWIGLLRGFLRQRKWYQASKLCYMSCPHLREGFLWITWLEPKKSENDPKTINIEGNTRFSLFRNPSTGSLGMSLRNMGSNLKGISCLVMAIWILSQSFGLNFGFHDEKMNKWIILKLIDATQMESSTRSMLHVMSAPLGRFMEKNTTGPGESENAHSSKNWRLYNTRFWTFSRLEHRKPWGAS